MTELHTAFTEVDLAGRFHRAGGFAFGKHRGRPLVDITREDPDYLEWILEQDFLDDVKRLVARHLAERSHE